MITYIDAKNALKYQILFEKATQALNEHPSESRPEEVSISTLNDYYAYLPDLMNFELHDNEDEDVHRYFAKVPLDEDYFKIDADTRTVTIPTAFARNGVGVQGDEIAEVVYFSIDRYFDSIDLASVDNIVIQWQTRNGSGISQHFGKSIEVIDGREKIVFGWPISSKLTGTAGTIRFAVRFYSVDTAEQVIKYSLATLPAEVTINATLDYDLFDTTIKEPDQSSLITNRIKSAGVYNPEEPQPGTPVIVTPLHVNGKAVTERIVDLPTTGDGLKLVIGAKPRDIGVVGYQWKKFVYNNGEYIHPASDYNTGVTTDYVPASEPLEDKICYTIVRNADTGVVTATVIENTEGLEFDEEEGVFLTAGGNVVYEKVSVASVNSVGIYTTNLLVSYKTNKSNTLEMADTEGIKIPGPETPEISFIEGELVSDDMAHILSDDGASVTLRAAAHAGEYDAEGNVKPNMGAEPDVDLSYQWAKKVGETLTPVAGATALTLEIEDLAATNLDETYVLQVTARRNNETVTAASKPYRITNSPIAPTISVKDGSSWKVEEFDADNPTVRNTPLSIMGRYNSLSFRISDEKSDKLSYIWMKAKIDENDVVDGNYKLAVDIDENLPTLFPDKVGDMDVPLTDDGNFALLPIPASMGSVAEDAPNAPVYQLNENSTPGYYYCIIVNELNGHLAANVTPFFNVQ